MKHKLCAASFDKKLTETEKTAVEFLIGGTGYGLIEVLWRGSTHPSMVLTGGACFILMKQINRRLISRRVLTRCFACSAAITGMEFAVGCVVNKLLGMHVWDYSSVKFNVLGQICPLYSAYWFLISIPVVLLFSAIEKKNGIDVKAPAKKGIFKKRKKTLSFSEKV